jgi:PIN domain nuclease of toxin-antitoxin system
MKLLLDTHTFIWWDSDPLRLTPEVLEMCQDTKNLLLLTVASVWEMQIKRTSSKHGSKTGVHVGNQTRHRPSDRAPRR